MNDIQLEEGVIHDPASPALDLFHVIATVPLDYSLEHAVTVKTFADSGCDHAIMSQQLRDKIVASGSYERRPIHAHIELGDAQTVISLLDEYEYKLLIGLQLNGNRYYVNGWFAVSDMSSAYDIIFSNQFLKRTGLKLFIADPALWNPQLILAPEETPAD